MRIKILSPFWKIVSILTKGECDSPLAEVLDEPPLGWRRYEIKGGHAPEGEGGAGAQTLLLMQRI
jgi:hypothetical protein